MSHDVWDPPAGAPMSTERRVPQLATAASAPLSPVVRATACDATSFDAGQDCGTRVAACIARLSALELIDGSRWWNRRARRAMAGALVAHADELESGADAAAEARRVSFRPRSTVPKTILRSV